jgi:hypothetical protein
VPGLPASRPAFPDLSIDHALKYFRQTVRTLPNPPPLLIQALVFRTIETMLLKTLLSVFLASLAAQSTAFPLNQNDKRASYSVVNVDGSNGSNPTGNPQAVTETVTQTVQHTITPAAVTVTVTQTPTATPYDDGLWHPPYYKVADPSAAAASSTPFSSTLHPYPSPTAAPTYRNTTI